MKSKLYILLCLLPLGLWAENVEHEDILKIQYGGSWRQDQYLTPLLYQGMMVGIGNEWWQDFCQDTPWGKAGKLDNWSHVGKINAQFDWTYSPVKNNVLYSVRLEGGWGAQYNWKFSNYGIQLLLGPYLSVDNTIKYHIRNVNKPISMDLACHIMAQGGLRYMFKGKKSSYRLQYLVRANLIGVDFMPNYWESYYELTEQVKGDVRCAGMWNHRVVQQELTLDMQFPHSTWRLGVVHEYNEFGRKDMMFSHEQLSAVVGTCFRYRLNPKKDFTVF